MRPAPHIAAALALLTLTACASAPPPLAEEEAPSFEGTVEALEGQGRVWRYTSRPWSFSTASYWIEGPEGVVVIDTQFVTSAAEEVIAAAEQTTGKKVVAAFVLHANPDKFNGTAAFQTRGVKVLTSDQVIALIPDIHDKRVEAFYDRYKPDYPLELPRPESLGGQSTTLKLAGLDFKVHVMGPGCSEAHIAVEHDGHLFAGDLIANEAHSWLEIGRTDAWLERIDELEALSPRFVHPGRGPSGGPELLANERDYLQKVIDLVAAEDPALPVDKKAIGRIKARLEAAYPDHRFDFFLHIGLPAEWRRQAGLSDKD